MRTRARILFLFLLAAAGAATAEGRTYDITRYDLLIEPDFRSRRMKLSARVEIANPDLDSTFSFGLNERYGSIDAAASANATVRIERSGSTIQVVVHPPSRDPTLSFALEGALGRSGDEEYEVVGDSSLFLLWSDRFYPIDMSDWAVMTTTVVLPAGFEAIAPGRPAGTRELDGGMCAHLFETSGPVVCASVAADARWIRSERTVGGIAITTLLHPESQRFAEQILETSGEVLGFYAQTYGFYPFDGFAFITLRGLYARRAFPGFVGYDPAYLKKEMETTGHDAHETALLWWGYATKGSGPSSFQWTEGFGDYAEILYDERYGKPRPSIFRYFREKYLAMKPEEEPPYTALRGEMQPVIHGKYPWLLHLLRYLCGDDGFGRAMRLVFERYRYRTFSMDELVATLEEGTGRPLGAWRREWIDRQGVPVLRLSSSAREASGAWEVEVIIEQEGAIYHMPLEIGIETAEGMRVETIGLDGPRVDARFRSPAAPRRVVLDPNGWILFRTPPAD